VSPTEALVAIPLWAAAGIFVGVIAAKIVRAFTAPHDAEDYFDF
jgi:hypothetical protein